MSSSNTVKSAIDPGICKTEWKQDSLATAHLLAGIEPAGLQTLDKTYPLKDMSWYHDERFGNLIHFVTVISSVTDAIADEADRQVDEGEVVHRITKELDLCFVRNGCLHV